LLGALFESLVTLGVRTYAQRAEASVGHLRTHRGDHEVDLIVERDDGCVVALALGAGVVTLLAPPGALASRVDVARRWTR